MFAPWLDLTHQRPARPGEPRWFVVVTESGQTKDVEVDGPSRVTIDGKELIPHSRTFIPASLKDNPFLVNTGYQAQLDALPEPYRSAVRDGNFMAARKDDERQVIPTAWVLQAQSRWTPRPPQGVPMCAMGVDVAAGGDDETVIAMRYDGWYAPLIGVPGRKTPDGAAVAGLVMQHRRGSPKVVIDVGGGYGGAPFEHIRANGIEVVGYKGAAATQTRTKDRQLKFVNTSGFLRGKRPKPRAKLDATQNWQGRKMRWSVQVERDGGVAQFAGGDDRYARYLHRVQLALDVPHPEVEEAAQYGEVRLDVEMLPDEGLEQMGMIGQMVEDLCRGHPIAPQLQPQLTHRRYLRRSRQHREGLY
jgi:hypothetical protein